MGRIGLPELLVILIIAVLVFGGSRIAGIGKSLGRGIRDFKDELHTPSEKKEEDKEETPSK